MMELLAMVVGAIVGWAVSQLLWNAYESYDRSKTKSEWEKAGEIWMRNE